MNVPDKGEDYYINAFIIFEYPDDTVYDHSPNKPPQSVHAYYPLRVHYYVSSKEDALE